jgi:hypothetical protein
VILRKRSSKSTGMALMAGFLMSFDFILHPKGTRMEDAQGETCRKKDALSGAPLDEDKADRR